jgi:hypothetical protein
MSVLKLRRDQVVVEEEPAVEIDKPFPLRKIDHDEIEGEITEVEATAVEIEEPRRGPRIRKHRTFFGHVRFWFNIAIVVVAVAAYPFMMVTGSDVGDRNVSSGIDRTRWTSPAAGGVVTLMEQHFNNLGWAKDAAEWSPMGRLTGKPAYQAAMAGSLGEFVKLTNNQLSVGGQEDPDLTAASRLISEDATGAQLRAARDALTSYDRRLKRRASAAASTPAQIIDQLALIDSWSVKHQTAVAKTAETRNGVLDNEAVSAVYGAKGAAVAAYTVLDTMHWPDASRVATQRSAALAAWKEAAEFHPMFVLNGSPDGSLFGNHAASMGFLLMKAQQTTSELADAVRAAPAPTPIIANAVAPGTFK